MENRKLLPFSMKKWSKYRFSFHVEIFWHKTRKKSQNQQFCKKSLTHFKIKTKQKQKQNKNITKTKQKQNKTKQIIIFIAKIKLYQYAVRGGCDINHTHKK